MIKGFQFGGIPAGIKKNGKKDLGLIFLDQPGTAAALFTKNLVQAAPVILGKEKMKKGRVQAVLANSGNANCFTGQKGMEDAAACSRLTADRLGIDEDLVMVSSTGVIGAPLPMEKFGPGIHQLAETMANSKIEDFADAILTTDLVSKIVTVTRRIDGQEVSMAGVCKGSGMIRPDMATMLAYVCTDAEISSALLSEMLVSANGKSFNRISVDGDTSTNDTLLAMASGASNVKIKSPASRKLFQEMLDQVCLELAKKIVRDGEGATKMVEFTVKGALTPEDAFKVCDAVGHSNLVKTAVYGEDPNWGRVTAAAGRSGAQVDQDRMDLSFDAVPLVIKGVWQGKDAETQAAQVMKNKEIKMTLDLNLGTATDTFIFCDFSEMYVKINADYRS